MRGKFVKVLDGKTVRVELEKETIDLRLLGVKETEESKLFIELWFAPQKYVHVKSARLLGKHIGVIYSYYPGCESFLVESLNEAMNDCAS